MNHDSPAEIRLTLERLGVRLKKRWGQNFLVNRGARERIVELLDPRPGDLVWEIGPGLGAMTELLLGRGARVAGFEVDRGICRYLAEEAFAGVRSFSLVPGDFLRTWPEALDRLGRPVRLLGNLPYRSASLMIAAIVEAGLAPDRCVFTVQRELAERMVARPGTKSYSSFSVLCQACFEVSGHGDLQPGSFWPAPEVVSSIVEMRPRPDAPGLEELRRLTSIARSLFASRRKTIRNNVKGLPDEADVLAALEQEGIAPGARAEELPPERFLGLVRRLSRRPDGPAAVR